MISLCHESQRKDWETLPDLDKLKIRQQNIIHSSVPDPRGNILEDIIRIIEKNMNDRLDESIEFMLIRCPKFEDYTVVV